jgi:hypothetical protein
MAVNQYCIVPEIAYAFPPFVVRRVVTQCFHGYHGAKPLESNYCAILKRISFIFKSLQKIDGGQPAFEISLD